MPVGNVLVGDTGGHIEHDHTALAVDIVTISQTTKLLLSSSIPDIKLNRSQVLSSQLVDLNWGRDGRSGVVIGGAYGGESKGVHFDTESCDVLLLELASKVTLDEGGLYRVGSQQCNPTRVWGAGSRVNKFFVDGGNSKHNGHDRESSQIMPPRSISNLRA